MTAAAVENIVKKNIRLELPVKLTADERLEIAERKAELELQLEEQRERFAEVKAEWSRNFDSLEKRIAQCGHEILERAQRRVVECYERYIREGEHAGKVETVRTDTLEVVERRAADLLDSRSTARDDDAEDEDAAAGHDLLADAARLQEANGVEETEDGDVVTPDAPAKRKGGKAKRK